LAKYFNSLAYDFWTTFTQRSSADRRVDGVGSSPGAAVNWATARLRVDSEVADTINSPTVGGGRLDTPVVSTTTAFTCTSSHTATGLMISKASSFTAPPPSRCGHSPSFFRKKAGPVKLWWSVSSTA